jgi:hypothetical protein
MTEQAGGGWLSRLGTGLQNMGGALLPQNPQAAASMDPAQLAQIRNSALLQAGLGMMAAKENGAGFGQAALAGLGQGTNTYNGILQQSYQNAMESKRTKQREEIAKRGDQWEQLKYRTQRAERTADLDRDEKRWNEEQRIRASEVASGNAYRASGAAGNRADAALKNQQTQFLQTTANRVRALEQKGSSMMTPLTAAEQQELLEGRNILAGGTPQGLTGAQSRGMNFGLGGFDPSQMPGQGATGNPLLDGGFTGLE